MRGMRKLICGVLFAVLLCHCFALAEEAGATASIEYLGDGIWEGYVVKGFRGDGISFREWTIPDCPSVAPLLVLYHGASTDKGGVIDGAKAFADMGYVVVTPDLVGHGDCVTDEPLRIFDIISRSAKNIEQIVSFYADKDYVDAEHFGVAGGSLGGMTALYYAATSDLRPQCVLSFSGTPDFSSLLEIGTIYSIYQNGVGTPITTRKDMILIGYPMIVNSPDQNMDKLLSVPLLMVNGGADTSVPVEAVKAFAERAEASYPGQLTLVIDEEADHILPIEDWSSPEVKEFLEKNLPIGE